MIPTSALNPHMKARQLVIIVVLMLFHSASRAGDDGGFHSLAERRAVGRWVHVNDVEELFDRRGIAARLAVVERVRLARLQAVGDELRMSYQTLEWKGALRERLREDWQIKDLSQEAFRPVLKMASDFEHYDDLHDCGFMPGVAILIGDAEPDYILICCFTCHDIRIVRRPTEDHPLPQVSIASMSPELEIAIFALTQAAFPDHKDIQSFKFVAGDRSKTPLKKPAGPPTPPCAPDDSKSDKQ